MVDEELWLVSVSPSLVGDVLVDSSVLELFDVDDEELTLVDVSDADVRSRLELLVDALLEELWLDTEVHEEVELSPVVTEL